MSIGTAYEKVGVRHTLSRLPGLPKLYIPCASHTEPPSIAGVFSPGYWLAWKRHGVGVSTTRCTTSTWPATRLLWPVSTEVGGPRPRQSCTVHRGLRRWPPPSRVRGGRIAVTNATGPFVGIRTERTNLISGFGGHTACYGRPSAMSATTSMAGRNDRSGRLYLPGRRSAVSGSLFGRGVWKTDFDVIELHWKSLKIIATRKINRIQ